MIKPEMKALAVDIAERVFWTFAEAFLALMLVSPVWNMSALRAAAIAGLAAAATYVKATASTLKAGTVSPASLAPAPTPTEDVGP